MTIAYTTDNKIIRAMQAALSVVDSAIIAGDDSDDTAEAYDLLCQALADVPALEARLADLA